MSALHVQSVVECGVAVEREKYQKNYQPFLVSLSLVCFYEGIGETVSKCVSPTTICLDKRNCPYQMREEKETPIVECFVFLSSQLCRKLVESNWKQFCLKVKRVWCGETWRFRFWCFDDTLYSHVQR